MIKNWILAHNKPLPFLNLTSSQTVKVVFLFLSSLIGHQIYLSMNNYEIESIFFDEQD